MFGQSSLGGESMELAAQMSPIVLETLTQAGRMIDESLSCNQLIYAFLSASLPTTDLSQLVVPKWFVLGLPLSLLMRQAGEADWTIMDDTGCC